MYFSATDNITDVLVQKLNAETVRIDMSVWHLTEHSITIALLNRFNAGVPVRLIGDRAEIFELNPITRREVYSLAAAGVPIRLRFNPTWYPEIDHWKTTIFAGQNLVAFGSANYTPFELAPFSSTNYKDETVLLTDDPSIVNAIKTKFDRIWNDTTPEPESMIAGPPYLKNWYDACEHEPTGNCADFSTLYPDPAPMVINTARLEPDNPLPLDLIWGQGPSFNNRLVQEINAEPSLVQLVIFRLTVDNITTALLNKWRAGVPVQLFVEPQEYLNRAWPEFWLTHANLDKMWAAGIPMKERAHAGLTHMKTLVTSAYATNASSNYAQFWQRDIDQFIPALSKPTLYQAVKDRVTAMWNDPAAFVPFQPQPPDAATLASPVSGASGVATTATLVWNRAAFAVGYDVYVGTSQSNLTFAGNVPAIMTNDPPTTYFWTPPAALQPGTTYFWKVVSRTNATPVNPSLVAVSPVASFTTAGPAGPPPVASNPTPSNNATGVGTTPMLGWAPGAAGTTFDVAFGTASPPPRVAAALTSPFYATGPLAANTTYYWSVTAVSSGGSTAGPIWSFTTGSGAGSSTDVVIYAADVTDIHGSWSKVADSSAAAGVKLTNPDASADALAAALASPTNYFDVQFQANAGTRYRLWMRIHAAGDSKWNDSVFVQFSDSVNGSGSANYRTGTTDALMVNLWTCSTCQSFGWGWQRNAYWLADTGDVWFQNTGTHTLRVQIREDGSDIDQIILSPTTYATNAPGPVSNDTTIVPKPVAGPAAPGTPAPANGATGISANPTLTWNAAGATSYDIAFGAANPPPVIVSGQTTASYAPSTLTDGTTYFWRITARNSSGSTTGSVWSFTTAAAPPSIPASPNPADMATGIATNVTLTWAAAGATSYDVLLDTSDPPSEVATNISTASYTPSGLVPGTTYIWQIVAHNSRGTNQGPQWTFTTAQATPPGVPAAPNPANMATDVSATAALSWSATNATSFDVKFGTTNPPPQVVTGQAGTSYSPAMAAGTTYFWQVIARNANGSTAGAVWSFSTAAVPPPPANIVIYASDIPPGALHGSWTTASDATAANGTKLVTPDNGFASTDAPLATPTHYVDVTFTAPANTPYTLWLRLQALNNSKWNDSLWVQFSDARVNGAPIYPLNSTSALDVNLATDATAGSLNRWGWQNGAYWLSQPTTVTFAANGTHTLRIQLREDGAQLDQIVLSPTTFLNTRPGSLTDDSTIVPKP